MMRAYLYGHDDTTGDPVAGQSLIVFAETEAAADVIAAKIYTPWDLGARPFGSIKQGGVEIAEGVCISAFSYYGVSLTVEPQQ